QIGRRHLRPDLQPRGAQQIGLRIPLRPAQYHPRQLIVIGRPGPHRGCQKQKKKDQTRKAHGREDGTASGGYLVTQTRYLVPGIWYLVQNTRDRKSTRLNSSHLVISYAVFCLKKKIKQI